MTITSLTGNRIAWVVVLGSAMLLAAYWTTFALTMSGGLRQNAWAAVNNTVPAIVLGLVAHALLQRFVWPRGAWVGLLVQPPLAFMFAVGWYLSILVGRAMRTGWLEAGISVRPFVPIAFVWQMFQGVTFYAVVALASLSINLARRLSLAEAPPSKPVRPDPTAILVRRERECESVQIQEIVSIGGAGDYCEVVLDTRRILSTSTMMEFEDTLPVGSFLRIHRSSLVRIEAIIRTEPAGNGRTIVHLKNGDTAIASRSGTRLLRTCAL